MNESTQPLTLSYLTIIAESEFRDMMRLTVHDIPPEKGGATEALWQKRQQPVYSVVSNESYCAHKPLIAAAPVDAHNKIDECKATGRATLQLHSNDAGKFSSHQLPGFKQRDSCSSMVIAIDGVPYVVTISGLPVIMGHLFCLSVVLRAQKVYSTVELVCSEHDYIEFLGQDGKNMWLHFSCDKV